MTYTRKARRSRTAAGSQGRVMPEGVVLVGGRGGSKDAAYAFADDIHAAAEGGQEAGGAVPRPLPSVHGWAFWDSIGRPRHVCAVSSPSPPSSPLPPPRPPSPLSTCVRSPVWHTLCVCRMPSSISVMPLDPLIFTQCVCVRVESVRE